MFDDIKDIAEDSVRGGFLLFTGNTLSIIILAVGSIITARLLGPENYGLYSLALVVPLILVNLMDLGINPALTRFLARLRREDEITLATNMIRSGILFKLLTGLSISIICFIFSDQFATYILNRPDIGFLVRLGSILIVFQSVLEASNSAFIGSDKMENYTIVVTLQSTIKTISSILLVIIGFGIVGALIGHISGSIVASLVGSLILLKYYRKLDRRSSNSFSSSLKIMLSYGFPLFISALLLLFISHYMTIVLAFYSSNVEIGNFNVATTLSATVSILVFPLGVLFPTFSKLNTESDDFKKIFKLSVKYTAMLIVPATVVIAITSNELVYTFYGQRYDLAPRFLSLFVLKSLYSGFGSMVLSHLLNGLGETKKNLKANLITTAIFIPIAPPMTFFYGAQGLIIALIGSTFFSLIYLLHVIAKKYNLRIDIKASLKIYSTAFLSAIPLLIFLQISPLNILFNLIFGGVLYLYIFITIAPLIKTVTKEDIRYLKEVLIKIRILHYLIHPVFKYEELLLNISEKQHVKDGRYTNS